MMDTSYRDIDFASHHITKYTAFLDPPSLCELWRTGIVRSPAGTEVFPFPKINHYREQSKKLKTIPVSLPAWQGDDAAGFENVETAPAGGCRVTGNYPGRARRADELLSTARMARQEEIKSRATSGAAAAGPMVLR